MTSSEGLAARHSVAPTKSYKRLGNRVCLVGRRGGGIGGELAVEARGGDNGGGGRAEGDGAGMVGVMGSGEGECVGGENGSEVGERVEGNMCSN